MSSKRANAMSKINDFSTVDIRDTTNPDDAVAAFLGKPLPSTAPGTKPTTTKETIKATVGNQEEVEVITKQGATTLDKTVNEITGIGQGLATGTYNRLSNTPIPGGIGVPLTILLILFIVLLPVNGHTRLMWLWLSLTGQAEIGGPLTPPTLNSSTSGGASGDFSYNTGSPNVNPNQTGTTTKPASATKIVSTSKHNTTVRTNTSKTHGTVPKHIGGGPGPMDPSIPDPTAPIAQLSYAKLLVSRNGYE